MSAIPDHISPDKGTTKRPNPAYFGEFWRVDVFLNGVRQAYVTEAVRGPAGWIMQLQRDAGDRNARLIGKRKPPPEVAKLSGNVEFRWRSAGDV